MNEKMTTSFLYDEGEETWPNKLHLGCGGIYLDGYTNVDIEGMAAYEHPDLVEQNCTTIDNYYARLDGDMRHLPTRRQTVFDIRSDITRFWAAEGTVDKIVAIQVFEHLTPVTAIEALRRWFICLRHGGVLVLSVPDMSGTLDLIGNGNTEFALRHLRGRMTDDYNRHHAWYTQESLIEMLKHGGFERIHVLPNLHFYPAIVVRAFNP